MDFKALIKSGIRRRIPLPIRKKLCVFLNRRAWLSEGTRCWWTRELLRDFEEKDRSECHRFLWAHHLAYATTYETGLRFGKENIKGSRMMFFSDLERHLAGLGKDPARDVQSVLEVGCSLGYQLRYLEMEVFRRARLFDGVDIDRYAIMRGREYLAREGSRVRLICGDAGQLDGILGAQSYDVVVCTGVLMYLGQKEALGIITAMLRRCRVLLALSGLAHPAIDNHDLGVSRIREHDGAYVHNFDAMVRDAGGRIVDRRWEGERLVDGNSIYFVFAAGMASGQG